MEGPVGKDQSSMPTIAKSNVDFIFSGQWYREKKSRRTVKPLVPLLLVHLKIVCESHMNLENTYIQVKDVQTIALQYYFTNLIMGKCSTPPITNNDKIIINYFERDKKKVYKKILQGCNTIDCHFTHFLLKILHCTGLAVWKCLLVDMQEMTYKSQPFKIYYILRY